MLVSSSAQTSEITRGRFWTWVVVAVFAVACVALSAGKDLWLDELFTWYQVRDKSFVALREATATGFNLMPIGYFSLLWALDKLGLLTVWSARLFSIAAAVGGVLVIARWWRRCWGADVAFLQTSILLGSSAPLLAMAVEVRPYALAFFLAAVSLDCGCRLVGGAANWRVWSLNAGCAFALPLVSYPAGAYSAALATGVVCTCGCRPARRTISILTSYVVGWSLFLAFALRTLGEQVRSNPIGIRNSTPHMPELFGIYSTLVWFPFAIVVALGIARLISGRSSENTREPLVVADDSCAVSLPMLLWLLVPLGFFALAKLGGPTIWGERFFLPTAAAVVTVAGPVLAAFLSRHLIATRWHNGVGIATVVSIVAVTSTFWRANRDAPVRRFPAQITGEIASLPIVMRELNTYFHLLYYDKRRLDLRLYAGSRANAQLLDRVSNRLKPVVNDDLWQLPAFAVLVDDDTDWTSRLAAGLARHHLVIAERHSVSNDFVHEIWMIKKAP